KMRLPDEQLADLGTDVQVRSWRDEACAQTIFELSAMMLGEKDQEVTAVARAKVVTPKWSRWNLVKAWLYNDITHGHVIKRFWVPKVEWVEAVKTDVNTVRYAVRLCPHIEIPDDETAHVGFMLGWDDEGHGRVVK
ncbi:MAG: hypothetical protein GY809_17550, partial [Planctomycetes bacterium]|nr:hypothetical protein [Planctomycetota bacterium]